MTGKEYLDADPWLRDQYRKALRLRAGSSTEAASSGGECRQCLIEGVTLLANGLCTSCCGDHFRAQHKWLSKVRK